MYRTGEQQNAYNAMNSTKILGKFSLYNSFFRGSALLEEMYIT